MVSMILDIDKSRYRCHIDFRQYSPDDRSRGPTGMFEIHPSHCPVAIAAATASTKTEASARSLALAGCCGPSLSTTEVGVDGSVIASTHADGCGGDGCCSDASGTYGLELYDSAAREGLPDAALLASLGCGNPVAVAELRQGETV